MSMKTWIVKYQHRSETDNVRAYEVVAEDDDMAAYVGKESLEDDRKNWDPDPRNWSTASVSQIEVCNGCGGNRLVGAPIGQGAIR